MSEQLYVALTAEGMYLKEYTTSTHTERITNLQVLMLQMLYQHISGDVLKHRHMCLYLLLCLV